MKLINYIAAVALMSSLSVSSTNGMDQVKDSTKSKLSNLFYVAENGLDVDLYEALGKEESNVGQIIVGNRIVAMMSSEEVSNEDRINLAVALVKRGCVTGDSILEFLQLPKHTRFENNPGIYYGSKQLQRLVDQLITIDPNSEQFKLAYPYDIGYALLYTEQLTETQTSEIKKWLGLPS